MGWYLRKSLKLGPLRFNLSKSGVGTSIGVKGFRVGSGPKGPYLHAGRGGLYYRTSLASNPERSEPSEAAVPEEESAKVERTPTISDEVKKSFAADSSFLRELIGWFRRGR